MPTDEQLRDTLEMVNSGFVNIGGTYAADILEEVLRRRTTHAELVRVLTSIATIWPEPDSCGDLSVNGINDGKARLITAHSAVNTARKALGLSLHKFPGE